MKAPATGSCECCSTVYASRAGTLPACSSNPAFPRRLTSFLVFFSFPLSLSLALFLLQNSAVSAAAACAHTCARRSRFCNCSHAPRGRQFASHLLAWVPDWMLHSFFFLFFFRLFSPLQTVSIRCSQLAPFFRARRPLNSSGPFLKKTTGLASPFGAMLQRSFHHCRPCSSCLAAGVV